MKPSGFKPQNFQDMTLCAALDRLCREAHLIDTRPNISKQPMTFPGNEQPWMFIDSRRFTRSEAAGSSDLDNFLDSRPFMDDESKQRDKAEKAERTARVEQGRAFIEIVRPLFLALSEGILIAKGFPEIGKRQATELAAVHASRWAGEWLVIRRGNTAQVEFYIDITSEEPVAKMGAMILVYAGSAEHDSRQVAAALPPKTKGESKYLKYLPALESLMNVEYHPSLTEACRQVLQKDAGKDDNLTNKAKQLRAVYNATKGIKPPSRSKGKAGKFVEIP